MTVEEWKRKNPPIQRKPITNYDRIRSMTDEELAMWIFTHRWNDCSSLLGWLRQEAEEGENAD